MFNSSPLSSEAKNGGFQTLKASLKRLALLYLESAKLTAAEKLTLLFSTIILFIIAFILITIAVAFAAVALSQLLETALSPIASSLIMSVFFILLAVLIFILRKPLIINPTARFLSKLIMDIGKDHLNN